MANRLDVCATLRDMTPTLLFVLAVAPPFLLMIAGTAWVIIRAVRGGSSRTPYRVTALGIVLNPLACAIWLLVAAPQPLWVKLIGAPPLILVSAVFLARARRPPEAVDSPRS
jgi:hypothetical protein